MFFSKKFEGQHREEQFPWVSTAAEWW